MTGPEWTPAVVLLISLWKVVVCLTPTFDPINTIQIHEDTATGSAIGVLTVRDTTPSHITLTLSPTTQQNVYLNQRISIIGFYNASIVLQRKLDYETEELITDCEDVGRDGCFKHWCRKCAPGFFISRTACDVCPVPDVGCQVAECNSSSDSHCVRCFNGYQLQGGYCRSTPSSQCVDHPKADCASLQSSLNVCSEPTTACNYCPQYCKMCDTCTHSMPVIG